MLIAAVDIGGTKISAAVLDADFGILGMETFATAEVKDCAGAARRCHEVILRLCAAAGADGEKLAAVGVASPGPLDLKTGTIVHIPTLGWKNEPVKAYFEERFGCAVAVQNDTNAAALAEYVFGAAKGCESAAYITVSTGVGCGLVMDGRIYEGAGSAAGEIGHINFVKDGRACGCGGKGCIEAYASGRSIGEIVSERLGKTVTAKQAFELHQKGNECAGEVIAFAGDALGYAIALLWQLVDPAVVVLGGSVMKDYRIIGPYIHEAALRYASPCAQERIRIEKSFLEEKQVLLGAAYYAVKSPAKRGGLN